MCEYMFEKAGAPAVFLAKDATLSCFSSGRTSGLCLDFGYSGVNISPVQDGYVETKALNRNVVGGQYMDVYTKHVVAQHLSSPEQFHYKQFSAWSKQGLTPHPSLHAYLNLDFHRSIKESMFARVLSPEEIMGMGGKDMVLDGSSSNPAFQNLPPQKYELPDGRTISVVSASTDPDARNGFGPFVPNIYTCEYNDLASLEASLEVRVVSLCC